MRLTDDWANFPRQSLPSIPNPGREKTSTEYFRLSAISILPMAAAGSIYLIEKRFGDGSTGSTFSFWFACIAILWFVFSMLRMLDADLGTRLQLFGSFLGSMSQWNQPKGRQ